MQILWLVSVTNIHWIYRICHSTCSPVWCGVYYSSLHSPSFSFLVESRWSKPTDPCSPWVSGRCLTPEAILLSSTKCYSSRLCWCALHSPCLPHLRRFYKYILADYALMIVKYIKYNVVYIKTKNNCVILSKHNLKCQSMCHQHFHIRIAFLVCRFSIIDAFFKNLQQTVLKFLIKQLFYLILHFWLHSYRVQNNYSRCCDTVSCDMLSQFMQLWDFLSCRHLNSWLFLFCSLFSPVNRQNDVVCVKKAQTLVHTVVM